MKDREKHEKDHRLENRGGWDNGVLLFVFLILFEDPNVAQGRAIYKKYYSGCYGVKVDLLRSYVTAGQMARRRFGAVD